MSVTITTPAHNGAAFPNIIRGTYAIQAVRSNPGGGEKQTPPPPPLCTIPDGLTVTVTISSASAQYNQSFQASLECITNTNGNWSVPKPSNLPTANDYVITAVSSFGGSDQKTQIHNP